MTIDPTNKEFKEEKDSVRVSGFHHRLLPRPAPLRLGLLDDLG